MEILGKTLEQVTDIFKKKYQKGAYHASAIYREVFKRGNLDYSKAQAFKKSPVFCHALTNSLTISPGEVIDQFKEGNLTKFITRLKDGKMIESVIIPMRNYQTLCVSSQIGCKMGCRFCETGKMGFIRDLEPHEIVGQLFNAKFILGQNIQNIVFMGMGEPLDNFDSVIQAIHIFSEQKGFDIALRHITLSTAGLVSKIEQLNALGLQRLRLAVSINAAEEKTRSFLMPVNQSAPLKALKRTLEGYRLPRRGSFLFEYILIKGLNDRAEDAVKLAEFIGQLPVRLNLIPYNPVDGLNFSSPSDDAVNRFSEILTKNGVFVVKRWSKGCSLGAGCGQLGKQSQKGSKVWSCKNG